MKLINDCLKIKDDVFLAKQNLKPVVAIDSSFLSHGLPYPMNVNLLKEIKTIAEYYGVTIAVIGITEGLVSIGLTDQEINFLAHPDNVSKVKLVNKENLAIACTKKWTGSLTVGATMWIAKMVGIKVVVTDGIKGILKLGNKAPIASSDLEEFVNTDVVVVSTGIKPLFDLKASLDYLKSKSVTVCGYRVNNMPLFYAKTSTLELSNFVKDSNEFMDFLKAKEILKLKTGVLLVNPSDEKTRSEGQLIKSSISLTLDDISKEKIPYDEMFRYFTTKIAEKTEDKSLDNHLKSFAYNVKVACIIASAINKE